MLGYARQVCTGPIVVLSAQNGLLPTTARVAPYDLRLDDLTAGQLLALASLVSQQIRDLQLDEVRGPVLSQLPARYQAFLDTLVEHPSGWQVVRPWHGLRMGLRHAAVNQALRQRRPTIFEEQT